MIDVLKAVRYLNSNIKNLFGIFALYGNIFAESGGDSDNTQNSYEAKLGMKNAQYTAAVDAGRYSADKFARDAVGYGICQWTYWARKRDLLTYARQRSLSVGNLDMQLEFLYLELKNKYPGVLKALENAKSIREASDIVLTQFERPADQSEAVKVKRASYGQMFYDDYAKSITISAPPSASNPTPGNPGHVPLNYQVGKKYRLTTNLNVRIKTTKQDYTVIPNAAVLKTIKTGDKVICRATTQIGQKIWMFIGMSGTKEMWICADDGTKAYAN